MMGSISSEDQEAHPSPSSSSDLAHHHFIQLTLPPPPPPFLLSLSSSTSPPFQYPNFSSCPATTPHLRQLLIKCAELTAQGDYSAAQHLLALLFECSSADGDSIERLGHHFTSAISYRLNNPPTVNNFVFSSSPANTSFSMDDALHHSTFLTLNKITPFIRFIHLTANQAIIEEVDAEELNKDIHVIDFDIMQGFQWPPFMQALAERNSSLLLSSSDTPPPPMLRITGTGHDLNVLMRTGDRLLKFAQSLKLSVTDNDTIQNPPRIRGLIGVERVKIRVGEEQKREMGLGFHFNPMLIHPDTTDQEDFSSLLMPLLMQNETLAINCLLHLHKFTDGNLYKILSAIKSLNPRIVTFAEREANHKTHVFLNRFVEALDHYSAIFNSLEANLPPSSQERLAVEDLWFGREIMGIVAMQGSNRRVMHRRFESWELMFRSSGFSKALLSSFALSQAKLLLRLHYPSEGYKIHNMSDSFFLSWKNRFLFSISAWK